MCLIYLYSVLIQVIYTEEIDVYCFHVQHQNTQLTR